MGIIKKDYKIKIICGILFNSLYCAKKFNYNYEDLSSIARNINSIIEENFSKKLKIFLKVDLQSKVIKFDTTDYYKDEMGEEIFRYWISFSPVIYAKDIYKIKVLTNEIETEIFSDENKNRKVNIDSGYIEGSKLVLFSTKNYSHRVYLEEGIFAEVTLLYKNKNFQTLDWTYPDYRLPQAIEFFTKARQKMLEESV